MYRHLFIASFSVSLLAAVIAVLALADPPDFDPGQQTGSDPGVTVAASPALLVHTATIQRQTGYDYTREFTGRARATRSSELGFDQGGRLIEVLVDEGDTVATDDLLARLDTDRLRARRQELEAADNEAKADLALAKLTLDRIADIVDRGAVSQQRLDEARETWRAAQARADRVRRQIDRLEVDLTRTELRAPFTGVVVRRHVDEGRVLDAGSPVVTLQEDQAPEIRVGVAGRLIERLRVGDTYHFNWRGRTIEARLRAVLPLRSATARTVDALFDPLIDPSAAPGSRFVDLHPGDLLRLVLSERIDDPGLWLPVAALTEGRHGLWSVYVTQSSEGPVPAGLDASHQVFRHSVDVIHQEADRVFVRGSLRSDDQVVLDGLQRLVPQQWVRIAPAADVGNKTLAQR